MDSINYNKKWTDDDNEYLINNYANYGLKYCATNLGRTQRGCFQQAKKLGLKVSQETKTKLITKYTKELLEQAVKNSKCYADVIRYFGIIPQAGNFKNIKRHIEKNNINTSHFLTPGQLTSWRNKNQPKINYQKKNIEEYFKENINVDGRRLKEGLFEAKYKERKCEKCGQTENWFGEKLTLIIDHINGNHFDNRLENLRILCPNCNSTLPTHCSKNRIKKEKKHCKLCPNIIAFYSKTGLCSICVKIKKRKVVRPTYSNLLNDISRIGYSATGRKYNVSDNAIRKWIKQYEKQASVGERPNPTDS